MVAPSHSILVLPRAGIAILRPSGCWVAKLLEGCALVGRSVLHLLWCKGHRRDHRGFFYQHARRHIRLPLLALLPLCATHRTMLHVQLRPEDHRHRPSEPRGTLADEAPQHARNFRLTFTDEAQLHHAARPSCSCCSRAEGWVARPMGTTPATATPIGSADVHSYGNDR